MTEETINATMSLLAAIPLLFIVAVGIIAMLKISVEVLEDIIDDILRDSKKK